MFEMIWTRSSKEYPSKMEMEMRFATLLLIFSILTAQPFKCSRPSRCQSLIDYVSPNQTTLSDIKTLFGVKNLHSILGANLLSPSTSPNKSVSAKETIRIPFHCICTNGTGISNKRPIYKIQLGDSLDHIARDVFGALMTYQKIADVNNIPDPRFLEVGQELWIPLPCSCDDVDGVPAVHYGHVVADGSTVQQIAETYGTTQQTLLRLNELADPNELIAGAVLEVPLKVCTSTVNSTSPDYPLLVPTGTYTLTANFCVQCKCDSPNNLTLQCEQSPQGIKIPNWNQCPRMRCDNLSLGGTSFSTGCKRTCDYVGYTNNQIILTTLVNDPTCSTGGTSPNNHATKIGLQGSSWSWIGFSVHLVLLYFCLLW